MGAVFEVTAALLAAVAAAAATWWIFVFRRQLPLETALREKIAELSAARHLATTLFEARAFASDPNRALAEAAAGALEALSRSHPSLAFAVVARRADGGGALLAHRGGAWGQIALPSLRFESGILAEALSALSAPTDAREKLNGPLVDALRAQGYRRVEASGFQGRSAAGAIVAAALDDVYPMSVARSDMGVAAAALGSVAVMADDVQQLSANRTRLQGGLSAAMEELTQTHDLLIRKSREVKALHDVAQAVVGTHASSLAAIVQIAARSLDADLLAFLLLDEKTGELVTQPGAHGLEADDLLYRISLNDANSSSVRVFRSRKPFMTGDAQNDPQVVARYTKMWQIHSLMVIPLVVHDRALGVMRIGSRKANSFTAETLALAETVAQEASTLVEMAMLNRRLSETAEQLRALNRMKDDFVSTVGHEFKTPLTSITGFLTVLLDGEAGPLNVQQMSFLQIVKASAKRLSDLVSDLLDLSRLESGVKLDPQKFDLAELVTERVGHFDGLAREGSKHLRWKKPGARLEAFADRRWIGIVVDNLLSNALKFTRAGGAVSVSAQNKGEFILVDVVDDGIGVPVEEQDKIFERFFRASNRNDVKAPGTGLGLAIAREALSMHGGKIWFESAPNQGSQFHFVVPAVRAEARA